MTSGTTALTDIDPCTSERCPWCGTQAQIAARTDDVRGVSCRRHQQRLLADHRKALRILARTTR